MKIILVGIYMIMTMLGLVFMKSGGNTGTISMINKDITLAINWISLIGFVCYLISFLLYTKIIVLFDLSYIVPITTGIVQILTLVAAKLVFKEEMSLTGVIGAIIVISGIIIMNLPKTVK